MVVPNYRGIKATASVLHAREEAEVLGRDANDAVLVPNEALLALECGRVARLALTKSPFLFSPGEVLDPVEFLRHQGGGTYKTGSN